MRINCSITPTERAQLSYLLYSVNDQRAALNLPPVNQAAIVQEIIHRVSEMNTVNLCNVFITRTQGDKKVADYHPQMMARVKALYPHLNDKQVTHICNCVANELRKLHQDINQVELASTFFPVDGGNYSDFIVNACGKTIYVRVTVD